MILAKNARPARILIQKTPGQVQLADDNALGELTITCVLVMSGFDKEHFLFLISERFPSVSRLYPDNELTVTSSEPQTSSSFLAFLNGIFDVQFHGAAAELASRIFDFILCAAVSAIAALRIVGTVDDPLAAFGAVGAQIIQALQVAALALPVPDGIFHELERGSPPEIVDGKDRIENGLQSHIFPLRRRDIHLEEPVVRFSLDFDQIWDGNAGMDLGEVHAIPIHIRSADIGH
jgi:hypothetical protein